MSKACSIFFYDGWLGVAPTVINLAELLSKNDFKVTIYTRDTGYVRPAIFNDSISVIYFSRPIEFEKFIKLLNKIKLGSLVPTILLMLFAFQILIYQFKYSRKNADDSISLGVDTNGAILALLETCFTKSRLVYLSLELADADKESFPHFDRWRRTFDRFAYRRSVCLIIQDEDRFKSLCKYGRYIHKKVFYIANSVFLYGLNKNTTSSESSNLFRERFNLEKNEYPHLILQAGMIADEVFSKELATAFNSIKKSFSLIFHSSREINLNEPYIETLRDINTSNLYLSLDPLPYEQIDRVFISATIGLAFYRAVDDNFSQIAKASGKLSGYLKCGKPVLISDLQSLVQLNEKYQFGIVIKDPSSSAEVEQALEKVISNYDFYSSNAISCYEQEFDFGGQSRPFLEFIA